MSTTPAVSSARGTERWGLFDARTDPTADLYGWDLVADRLEELGILDDPDTFLFTRYWYQSAQIAHAIHLRLPVLCYNIDDPRGFAFWSKPGQWLGHDGILLMINDEFVPVTFYAPGSRTQYHLRISRSSVVDAASPRSGIPARRSIGCVSLRLLPPAGGGPRNAQGRGHPLGHLQQTARSPSSPAKLTALVRPPRRADRVSWDLRADDPA